MRTVNCKEPRVRPNNARNAAAYWAAIKPCLDRSWAPLVAKAGYTFRAPKMLYWSGTSVHSPCGDGPVNVPFYCSGNHMMYMKVDVFVKTTTSTPTRSPRRTRGCGTRGRSRTSTGTACST